MSNLQKLNLIDLFRQRDEIAAEIKARTDVTWNLIAASKGASRQPELEEVRFDPRDGVVIFGGPAYAWGVKPTSELGVLRDFTREGIDKWARFPVESVEQREKESL